MAIKFDNKAPEWDNLGAEPDAELKKGGFLAGYKPPAAYFNWFFNRTYECVKELQEKLVSNLKSLAFKDKVGDDDITAVAANKVTQDSKHRMITDAERSTWNGKADASGGDVSEMAVKTLETITTEFPVPVAGECTKTFLGKVKKFFEDTKNWMTGVCLIGQIVNNCVTNNAKLPLSAAQGKVLMDLYTVLNTKKAEKQWEYIGNSFNDVTFAPNKYSEIYVCAFIDDDNSKMIPFLLPLETIKHGPDNSITNPRFAGVSLYNGWALLHYNDGLIRMQSSSAGSTSIYVYGR